MNTLLQYKQLTFEEINVLWKESCLGDGAPLPLRTFHQHKNAVEELFGVEIKCNIKVCKCLKHLELCISIVIKIVCIHTL